MPTRPVEEYNPGDIEDPVDEWCTGVFSDSLTSVKEFNPALESDDPITREHVIPLKAYHGAKQFGFQFGAIAESRDGKITLADDLEFLYRKPLAKGTLKGTTVAATEFYKRVIDRFVGLFPFPLMAEPGLTAFNIGMKPIMTLPIMSPPSHKPIALNRGASFTNGSFPSLPKISHPISMRSPRRIRVPPLQRYT